MAKPIFNGTKWDSQFFTAKDALAPRPPTKYLIENFLPVPSLSIFYGLPASFKTNLIIDAMTCVALGKTWIVGDDFAGLKTNQNQVMWIDADSGIDILNERFAASLRVHGKTKTQQECAKLLYASFLDPAFTTTDDASVVELINRAKKINAAAIVFDNLGTISGGVDENSPLMIPLMNRLRQISALSNTAVILIHHIVKNAVSNNGTQQRTAPRGHGSIEAAIDFAFHVSADGNLVKIENTKSRRAKAPTLACLFEYEHIPNTQDLKTMYFAGIKPELPPEYLLAKKLLLDFFSKNTEGNQSTIIGVLNVVNKKTQQSKIGFHKARAIIQTFVKSNFLIIKAGQAKNQSIYVLGDPNAEIILI